MIFETYLQEIFAKFRTGDASERTYYPVLEKLLKSFQEHSEVIIESRNSIVGIPDFKVETDKGLLNGYIEAKDLGRDLDRLSKEEQAQITKYLKEYPKLILTNFIEFRLFENGEPVDTVVITQPVTLQLGIPVLDHEGRIRGLLGRFFSTVIPKIHTSKRLSELIAHKTRVLRDLIREEINLTDEIETNTEKLLETFQKSLKPDMTPELFSDMYAQTITFGLFVARINSTGEEFNRFTAHSHIPQTIPLLKKVFWILSGQEVPQHIEWQVDEITEILANTNIDKITEEFFSAGKGRDPIIHFYETFLSEYDSSQREQLGVYYTPQPVVSYITKSLHKILKKSFGKDEGFADSSVITLDPAAGTLTFPAEAIALAKDEFTDKHGTGGWSQLVSEHILKNFYAFEILMAPYAVGHLKISLLLKELGHEMTPSERFPLYLTNTLDMAKFTPQHTILAEEFSEESEKAYEIKDKAPVLVVMGNPPYSGHSSNKGEWIEKQIEEYKKIDGKPLGEKNPKWLNDDYVKFIRFAQWKIERTGQGVLGFITNHAWLDNPTFRGMRYSLLQTFNEIYTLNLHGSALKKETVPKDIQTKKKIGERDEGVFGIRPGTAIILAVKGENIGSGCKVYYAEQWGLRAKKFEWLNKHDFTNTEWKLMNPINPAYYFIQREEKNWGEYKDFAEINDVFPVSSVGIVTSRDNFVIDTNKSNLENRIRTFINSTDTNDFIKSTFGLKENQTWRVATARSALRKEQEWEKYIQKILYRPFDERWIFYHPAVIERSRNKVMKEFDENNLGFLYTRPQSPTYQFSCLVSELIIDQCIVGNKTAGAGISYSAPLYTHEGRDIDLSPYAQQSLLPSNQLALNASRKSPNINWNALPAWMATLQPFTSPATDNFIQAPEAIFYYIYAVLNSNIYREKYKEFLKSDFPRIPFTNDYQLFKHLSVLGEQLVRLHIMKSNRLDLPISRYEGEGNNIVEKRSYNEESNAIYINNSQFFNKVSPEVWNYHVGGYQVLDKWLKDRIGRILSLEDQTNFRKIITALTETIDIQKRIDKFYPQVEKSVASQSQKKRIETQTLK